MSKINKKLSPYAVTALKMLQENAVKLYGTMFKDKVNIDEWEGEIPARFAEWLSESTIWIRVTPELAKFLIEHQRLYRPLIGAHLDRMKGSKYERTTNRIGLDFDFILIDGNHRLHRILELGITEELEFCFGLDEDECRATDRTATRKRTDRLGFDKVEVAAVTILHDTIGSPGVLDDRNYQNGLALIKNDLANVRLIVGAKHDKFKIVPVVTPLALAYRHSPDLVSQFIEQLRTGANLQPSSPVLRLRDYLTGSTRSKSRGADTSSPKGRLETMNKTANAISLFIDNRSVKNLQCSDAIYDLISGVPGLREALQGSLKTDRRKFRKKKTRDAVEVQQSQDEFLKAMLRSA